MRSELLIGCGASREKKLRIEGRNWEGLVTLDMNEAHNPDYVFDLEDIPLPFEDSDLFDEIHAYDVLEHTGRQGDWRFFFDQWSEFYRILKPNGLFFGISPMATSPWAWGDPGHTRIISPECLAFLSQPFYAQVGKTPATDYRFCWQGDLDLVWQENDTASGAFRFCLQAIKPARLQ